MRTITSIAVSLCSFLVVSSGCGDDEPSKGRLGATCEEPVDCESGLCMNQVCVNPAGGACTENRHCVTGLCLEGGTCAEGSIAPRGEQCIDGGCPTGQVCDPERLVCVPGAN